MTFDDWEPTLRHARAALEGASRKAGGFQGLLSNSALSTATASVAFALAHAASPDRVRADRALRSRAWLAANQNPDGGFGDTTESPTNISTTLLAWCAFGLSTDEDDELVEAASRRTEEWLRAECGGRLEPATVASTIRARYGSDQTFSVPILLTCALSGRLGPEGWRYVPNLPFEMAACPASWFKLLNLRTVSYALPALIAVGQARHHHRPTRNPITRMLRTVTRRRTLRILRAIQPSGGGYLEAAPLTSFVCMSLISMGLHDHEVVREGLRFLDESVGSDGSWPIDTNLDTWITSLAINAMRTGDQVHLSWLREQQHTEVHPYTRAEPGGWAWTDLPGGVPDADDTSGALLALRHDDQGIAAADVTRAISGVRWLLDLQNRDGGIPTFCRGWGKLPFDQSCPDITAHAMRAWNAWREDLPATLKKRIDRATRAAARYLERTQREDGAWVPLWFGNQHEENQENPVYGTSRVLLAAPFLATGTRERGAAWLRGQVNEDGGFGGARGLPSTIEETALAVEALASLRPISDEDVVLLGDAAGWLARTTCGGTTFSATPIGLYFASLWYSERLYPVVFTVAALESARECLKEARCRS